MQALGTDSELKLAQVKRQLGEYGAALAELAAPIVSVTNGKTIKFDKDSGFSACTATAKYADDKYSEIGFIVRFLNKDEGTFQVDIKEVGGLIDTYASSEAKAEIKARNDAKRAEIEKAAAKVVLEKLALDRQIATDAATASSTEHEKFQVELLAKQANDIGAFSEYLCSDCNGYLTLKKNPDQTYKLWLGVGSGSCGGEALLESNTPLSGSGKYRIPHKTNSKECIAEIVLDGRHAHVSDSCITPEDEENSTCSMMGNYTKK